MVVQARIDEIDRSIADHSIKEVLFIGSGIQGVYARTELLETIVDGLGQLISSHRPANAETLRFPPVMSRENLERQGYPKNFPHLLGCVSTFSDAVTAVRDGAGSFEVGGDWTSALQASNLALCPAACYPLYPLVAGRGALRTADGPHIFDVVCECFRHEPSQNLDRLQSFRMREFVCFGSNSDVCAFREGWIDRAARLADTLRLPYAVEAANDPFFGRRGRIAAFGQRQQELKFELVIPIRSVAEPTACMSFNYHLDHFSDVWNITSDDGSVVHTACVGFGLDRLALALFATHGLAPMSWPVAVRDALGLN